MALSRFSAHPQVLPRELLVRLEVEEARYGDPQHHQQEKTHPQSRQRRRCHIREYLGLHRVIECLKQPGTRCHRQLSSDYHWPALLVQKTKNLGD